MCRKHIISSARQLGLRNRQQLAVCQLFKRSCKIILITIKFDIHQECRSPSGSIIWGDGRASSILKVVRVILWFKHIEHVRTEGLISFHNITSAWVGLSSHSKVGGCFMHYYSCTNQGIEEFDRRSKINLIGWNDITSGISVFGIV